MCSGSIWLSFVIRIADLTCHLQDYGSAIEGAEPVDMFQQKTVELGVQSEMGRAVECFDLLVFLNT